MLKVLPSISEIQSPTTGPDTKQCRRCQKVASLSHFEHNRRICKTCRQSGKIKKINENPYTYLSNLYSHIKNKRARSHEFTIEREHLYQIFDKQKGLCSYTGIPMTHIKDGTGHHNTNISIDRYDNNKGYVSGNIRLVCLAVNMMKYTMDLDEFVQWCKFIAENN